MDFEHPQLGLASLESLARDETFQSLESLMRLFPKVSQNISVHKICAGASAGAGKVRVRVRRG